MVLFSVSGCKLVTNAADMTVFVEVLGKFRFVSKVFSGKQWNNHAHSCYFGLAICCDYCKIFPEIEIKMLDSLPVLAVL